MEKDISVERLYTIANYENIKFISTLRCIPEEVAMNPEAVKLLFYGSFLECDLAYKNYLNLRKTMVEEKVTNVVEFLEEERSKTHNQLLEEIKKASEDELKDYQPHDEGDK